MYIVPPKLNKKLLVIGLTVIEALVILGMFLLFMITRAFGLMPVIGIAFMLCCRFTGEYNAVFYFKIVFRYYFFVRQSFTRRAAL